MSFIYYGVSSYSWDVGARTPGLCFQLSEASGTPGALGKRSLFLWLKWGRGTGKLGRRGLFPAANKVPRLEEGQNALISVRCLGDSGWAGEWPSPVLTVGRIPPLSPSLRLWAAAGCGSCHLLRVSSLPGDSSWLSQLHLRAKISHSGGAWHLAVASLFEQVRR